jgi:copper(I)-binding protein
MKTLIKIILFMGLLISLKVSGVEGISLDIENVWARPSMGNNTSAIYMDIKNPNDTNDVLVSVECSVAKDVMLHKTVKEQEIATMVHLDKLSIPAQTEIKLSPGGIHIMLSNLVKQLEVGDRFNLKLVFLKAGEINLDVLVKSNNLKTGVVY